MKFATAIVAAAVAAVASAKSTWNFPAEGACIAACTNTIGKNYFPLYDDVNSEGPFFFVSLAYSHEYGPEAPADAEAFRSATQICMLGCSDSEREAYYGYRMDKMMWYRENK